MKCPECATELDVHTTKLDDETLKIRVSARDRFVNTLISQLHNYWRWVAEGKSEYRTKQYYYDDYHNHIAWRDGSRYEFSIQVFDSPEGDRWISGEFVLSAQGHPVISNEKVSTM